MPQNIFAKKIKFIHKKHDDIRVDYYNWMNQKENPELLKHLNNEFSHYKSKTRNHKELENIIYQEMKSRIQENESSVPYLYNGYWYQTKYKKGKQYPVILRKKKYINAKNEIIFDCNEMSKNKKFFDITGIRISPDNKFTTYATDYVSRREYNIKVKNIFKNKVLKTKIDSVTGESIWFNDSRHFLYVKKDKKTLRASKVYLHDIENPQNEDKLIFTENDNTFFVYLSKSKSQKYIFINSVSTLTTETQILDADNNISKPRIFQKRIKGLEYNISHFEDFFYVLTNIHNSHNYKIMRTKTNNTNKKKWKDFISHHEDELIEDFEVFKDFFVLTKRVVGLTKIIFFNWNGDFLYEIPVDGETYNLKCVDNYQISTNKIRYNFNSLTTPSSIIELDLVSKKNKILKQKKIGGSNFDKNNYVSRRIFALSHDKKKIPISIVYNKKTKISVKTPLILYAYGAYGHTIDPSFSSTRLTLLDRGFVFAIAHVRGGEYLGRKWYDDGRLLNKKNTFKDFISCSEYLIKNKFTSNRHLYAIGGSAGGLLMGVVANEAPELYNGIIASVPFVDVLTTMLDEKIPLTTFEYDEWGDPNKKKYYKYIKSYSPYDNIKKQNYPNMLVTSGFHDSQVQYWEPSKWVSKIRDKKTDNNLLLFNINMKTGHGGVSGRYNFLKELAQEYSFLMFLENIKK